MRNKSETGFTLIELLCALSVLAVVMAVALHTLSGSTLAVGRIDESQAMVALAESHLAELMTLDQPSEDEREGQSGPYAWKERIEPARAPIFEGGAKNRLAAWTMEVTVAAPSGRQFQLRSIRLVRPS